MKKIFSIAVLSALTFQTQAQSIIAGTELNESAYSAEMAMSTQSMNEERGIAGESEHGFDPGFVPGWGPGRGGPDRGPGRGGPGGPGYPPPRGPGGPGYPGYPPPPPRPYPPPPPPPQPPRAEYRYQVINCSDWGRGQTCSYDPAYVVEVRLQSQQSHSPCEYNRSYGIERNYIWVQSGCRADFLITRYY